MKRFTSLTLLCSIYTLTIVFGLYTAMFILPLMYPPAGVEPVIPPAVENPQKVESAGHFFIGVLVMTGVMLLLIKYRLGIIIKIGLFFSFFTGTFFTFSALFGDYGIILTLISAGMIALKVRHPLVYNIVLMFTISGVGALIGASLGFMPALALVLLMSVYDIIAVFYTKHMVSLAKGVQGKYPIMFTVPVLERNISLGAGDIALPLTFSVSVLASAGITYAVTVALGGLLGIVALFYYILGKKDVMLPALPPIIIGQIIGYGIAYLAQVVL